MQSSAVPKHRCPQTQHYPKVYFYKSIHVDDIVHHVILATFQQYRRLLALFLFHPSQWNPVLQEVSAYQRDSPHFPYGKHLRSFLGINQRQRLPRSPLHPPKPPLRPQSTASRGQSIFGLRRAKGHGKRFVFIIQNSTMDSHCATAARLLLFPARW